MKQKYYVYGVNKKLVEIEKNLNDLKYFILKKQFLYLMMNLFMIM